MKLSFILVDTAIVSQLKGKVKEAASNGETRWTPLL